MEILQEKNFKTVTRPKNFSIQIEEQLLNAISKGAFAVGEYLPSENELVEIFNVSRGVIREALLLLSAKGIVDIQKGKGALLLNPSINSILDPFASLVNYKCGNMGLKYVQEVRMMIEPQIALLAAKLREENDLRKLKSCIDNMNESKYDKKLLSFYDIEFHKTISRSCRNPMYSVIMEPIFHFLKTYHQETFEDLTSNQLTFEFHEKILNAIENKRSEEAFDAMTQHLTIANEDVKNLFKD